MIFCHKFFKELGMYQNGSPNIFIYIIKKKL